MICCWLAALGLAGAGLCGSRVRSRLVCGLAGLIVAVILVGVLVAWHLHGFPICTLHRGFL